MGGSRRVFALSAAASDIGIMVADNTLQKAIRAANSPRAPPDPTNKDNKSILSNVKV
jgi:hypothetical protein